MAKDNKDIEFDFFDIDINRLDEEWVNQPKQYFKYSEHLTKAKEQVERYKAQLGIAGDDVKEVIAKLDLAIRRNPKKYFKKAGKPTETAITNCILLRPKYKEAKAKVYALTEKLIKANTKVSTFYSAVYTLDHRKSALERLVSLHGQNYFSTPKATGMEETEKSAARKKSAKKKRRSNNA